MYLSISHNCSRVPVWDWEQVQCTVESKNISIYFARKEVTTSEGRLLVDGDAWRTGFRIEMVTNTLQVFVLKLKAVKPAKGHIAKVVKAVYVRSFRNFYLVSLMFGASVSISN